MSDDDASRSPRPYSSGYKNRDYGQKRGQSGRVDQRDKDRDRDRDRSSRNSYNDRSGGRKYNSYSRGNRDRDDNRRSDRNDYRRNDRNNFRRSDRNRDSDRYRNNRNSGKYSEKFEIDSDQVGGVIGRGGSNIKEIESQYIVSINVDKHQNSNGKISVLVCGDSQTDIDDCVNHIQRQVEVAKQRYARKDDDDDNHRDRDRDRYSSKDNGERGDSHRYKDNGDNHRDRYSSKDDGNNHREKQNRYSQKDDNHRGGDHRYSDKEGSNHRSSRRYSAGRRSSD